MAMEVIRSIQNRIYEIRGERVMPDLDLAALYNTETKILNQSVKRNIKRFPPDIMFQLTEGEWKDTGSGNSLFLRSQFVTLKTGSGTHRKYLHYADRLGGS